MATLSIEETATIIGAREPDGGPVPFSIEFVTCDMKRNEGGERIKLASAGIFTSVSKKALLASKEPGLPKSAEVKNGNWRNSTRNIQCLKTGKPYRVHLLLIEKINGTTVAL